MRRMTDIEKTNKCKCEERLIASTMSSAVRHKSVRPWSGKEKDKRGE